MLKTASNRSSRMTNDGKAWRKYPNCDSCQVFSKLKIGTIFQIERQHQGANRIRTNKPPARCTAVGMQNVRDREGS